MTNPDETPETERVDSDRGGSTSKLVASGLRLWGIAGVVTPLLFAVATGGWLGGLEGTRYELPDSANPIVASLWLVCCILLLCANLTVFCPVARSWSAKGILRRGHVLAWAVGSAVVAPTIGPLGTAFVFRPSSSHSLLFLLLSLLYLSPPVLFSQLGLLLSTSRLDAQGSKDSFRRCEEKM